MDKDKLSFGILCNGLTLQHWQAETIKELLNNPAFELKLIILNDNSPKKQTLLKRIISPTLFFTQYENRVLKIPARQPVSMEKEFSGIGVLKTKTVLKGKHSNYFADADIEVVKAAGLDFIIRFGFGIIKGEMLNAATYGIWSYHHGDEQHFRGGPPGFWEIFYKKPVTAAILQRLTPALDGGIILKKGYFMTIKHSYKEHLDTLLTFTCSWVKQAGLELLQGDLQQTPTTAPGKLYKAPRNLTFVQFLVKHLYIKARKKYNSLFRVEMWNIGVLNNTVEDIFTQKNLTVSWLPGKNDKTLTYRADPFVLRRQDKLVYFYEKFNYQFDKGHIASMEFDMVKKEFSQEEIKLKPAEHLSYPSVFEHKGRQYCMPECFESNQVDLYEILDGFYLQKNYTLLQGQPFVDPTLLYYNNKYWLFCTIKNQLANAQLYIFYSDALQGPYQPHLMNPVKTDIASARPAGNFFYYDGDLIRPSQNCSLTYGGSLVLNKVVKLTETIYSEEKIAEVFPLDSQYNKGIHHLCMANDILVVDGKKFIFSATHALRQILGT